jgi:2-oxo-4-hydroxy-4-carboxy-5-ureidoimidazoline decarboxylase
MRLEDLNALDADAAARELLRCCGSSRWARRMAASRPFASPETMVTVADKCWGALDQADWLEAFAAHPRIGAGRARGAGGVGKAGGAAGPRASWPEQEQAGVADAAAGILVRLADANRDYEARFGYIFIVCASGKSAAEMLDMLERRMGNDPETEVHIAANEQRKITRLRLMKLVDRKQDTTE